MSDLVASASFADRPRHAKQARAHDDAVPLLRKRLDLVARALQFRGQTYWSIKDPARLRYFQLREEEYFVLQALDGKQGLATIQQRFDERFAPARLGEQQLSEFLVMLHGQGLVVGDLHGQAGPLLARRERQQRQQWLARLTSVLAIRFRGVDPDRFLDWLYPKCRWLFSTWFLLAAVVLVASALTMVVVRNETLAMRLPSIHAFFHVENLIWLAVAVGLAKVLHEMGHALACKHFGGECHEMGVMFLVFTPCLYCNVSDAWMMRNKWHRIAVSGAGMMVEIVLAAICTFLWWFSEPGLLNSICVNTMVVCSVSTLLFNGNPLLRYDGYYILSDLVEIPNLRQQSATALRGLLARTFLGVSDLNRRVLSTNRRGFLVGYAVASLMYRILVVAGILWLVHVLLKPHGLQVVAQFLAVLLVLGMVLTPLTKMMVYMNSAIRRQQVKRIRATLVFTGVGALILAVLLVPLPSRVHAPLVVESADAARVFVTMTGRLPTPVDGEPPTIRLGHEVSEGQPLVRLTNASLEVEIAQLDGRVAVLRERVRALRTLGVRRDSATNRLPATEEALRNTEQQLREKIQQRERLTLTAPAAGTVLPAESRQGAALPGELESWSGAALDPKNAGGLLEAGTTLCQIGNPKNLEAVLVIDQADVEFVRKGQTARIWLPQVPGRMLTGRVTQVGESRVETVPVELAKAGKVATTISDDGIPRPTSTSFQARIAIDPLDAEVALRSTGKASISVSPSSLGHRLYRYACDTFRFEL